MLIVADQVALRVSGKCGLAGAGEAEEDGYVALRADVGRAVHGEHALQRQEEIEHGEDGLLDFTGVARASDDGEPLTEIEDDERLRARAINQRRSKEAGHGDDGELGDVFLERILVPNLQKHGAREEAVPGFFRDNADGQAVLGVSARTTILHEYVPALQIALQASQQSAEVLAGEGAVVLPPPDLVLGGLFADHEFVGSGSRRVLAGAHQQGTEVGEPSFRSEHTLLVESGSRQVPVDAAQVRQAVILQAVVAGQRASFLHRWRLNVEVDIHSQSLTSLRSPR